jgi:hypothetical protein
MSTSRTLHADHLELASGAGLLVRRPAGVLFTGSTGPSATALIEAFAGAADAGGALDAVLAAAVDHDLAVAPFVMVAWQPSVHVVVFGDLVVTTDLPSLPSLGAAGLATWVEHRTPRPPERCEIRLGGQTVPGTNLAAGVAPAGGFRLILSNRVSPAGDEMPASHEVVATRPADAEVRAAPAPPEAGVAPEPAWRPSAVPAASWEVLRDAGGGWMDDSLRIADTGEPRTSAPANHGARPASTVPAPRTDRTSTTTGAGGGAAESTTPTPGARGDGGTADGTTPTSTTGVGGGADARRPPTTAEHNDAAPFDPEITLDPHTTPPPALASAEPPPLPRPPTRAVQARRCDLDHLNPPLRTTCRTCGRYIPPATQVETVPQPALAALLLPDGRRFPIAGPIVVGRRPTADAARLEEPGELLGLDGDPAVSRTHVVVAVDGWTLLVTDCAATAGTAIAPAGGEPILLEPWIAHEVEAGTTVFLGASTQLRVVAIP